MKKNEIIELLEKQMNQKLILFLMFITTFCFAQKPKSIIGFVKYDNTRAFIIPDSNNKYEKFKVQKTDTLEIYDYSYDYPEHSTLFWLLKFKGAKGYIPNFNMFQSKKLIGFKKVLDEKIKLKEKALDSIRFTKLKNKWGAKIAKRIVNKEYWIGMSREMCKKSLGYPDDINSSRGSWGLHEQWIYKKPFEKYLYFENGILTSYQF